MYYLVHGYCYFDDPFESEEEAKKAYFRNKEAIFSIQGRGRMGVGIAFLEKGALPWCYRKFDPECPIKEKIRKGAQVLNIDRFRK